MPRSIVRHFEFEIAKLEKALQRANPDIMEGAGLLLHLQRPLEAVVSDPKDPIATLQIPSLPREVPNTELLSDTASSGAVVSNHHFDLQSVVHSVLPRDNSMIARIRLGFSPSTTKSSSRTSSNHVGTQAVCVSPKPSPMNGQLRATLLFSLPVEIIQGLVKKYATTITPQFSFMLESEFTIYLQTVLNTCQARQTSLDGEESSNVEPSVDFLIIYLILAISITIGSVKGGHEVRCMSLSTSLFQEGIQHLSDALKMPSDLVSLRVNLLVLLYATINPRAGNVWILSGVAMRACTVGTLKCPSS